MSGVEYDVRKDLFTSPERQITQFVSVGFMATERCNLQCVHCCEGESTQDIGSLQTEHQVIKNLASGGTKRVCVTGGEPLLRRDLVDLLRFIHAQNISVSLATNGLLLTKAKLKEIRPYIENVRFSLYGEELTHDRTTGRRGSFKKIMDSIEHAKDLNLPVGVISVVMAQNYPEMLSLARLCAEKGVDVLHFFSLMPKGKGAQIYPQEYVPPARIKQVVADFADISRQESWGLRINAVDWDKEGQCVLVYPNGDLAGSPSYSDQDAEGIRIVGNLLRQTPTELWNDYPFKDNYASYYRNH